MEKKILVIGDSCVDSYAYCKSTRLAPDKPVPAVTPVISPSASGLPINFII